MIPGMSPDMLVALAASQLDSDAAQLQLAEAAAKQLAGANVLSVTFAAPDGSPVTTDAPVAVIILVGHLCNTLGIDRRVTWDPGAGVFAPIDRPTT